MFSVHHESVPIIAFTPPRGETPLQSSCGENDPGDDSAVVDRRARVGNGHGQTTVASVPQDARLAPDRDMGPRNVEKLGVRGDLRARTVCRVHASVPQTSQVRGASTFLAPVGVLSTAGDPSVQEPTRTNEGGLHSVAPGHAGRLCGLPKGCAQRGCKLSQVLRTETSRVVGAGPSNELGF